MYQDDKEIMHTSSDGQKYNVSEDSLNASYSYKYHGKSKGISEYTFIDAHSTDSHGYSETVFAVSFLLGFTFAPRIKNVHHQYLFALKPKGYYKKKDYPILPDLKIKESLIEIHWDDILRFVATIQLKETTASQLFRRLNSYSKDNPLYLALKELGRIIKTIFILTYIDDPEFRETIQKQLNKGESGNKLSRALNVGNPEFSQATKEDQEIAESCKRLIKNAIVCWNYMYLTQELANEKDTGKKGELLSNIKRGSVVSWNHLNLHSEFDFSDEKLKDSFGFKIPQILREKLPENEKL